MELTRQAILKFLQTGGITTFRRIMLRYFGLRITKRGLMTRVVPLVGGVVGGGWNYVELKVVGDRVYRYFEDSESAAGEKPAEVDFVAEVPAEEVLPDEDGTANEVASAGAIEPDGSDGQSG
jgi:hypothetical protein